MKYQLEGESESYRASREALLEAEIALKDQVEKVAALRRELTTDTPVEDYMFVEGPRDLASGDTPVTNVKLSELFETPDQPLLLVHFMYGKKQTSFCPMCTMWADGYNGVVPHLRQRANFAILVAGGLADARRFARSRGWHNIRFLSSGDATIKADLGFEDAHGGQLPGVSAFKLEDGGPRHFYSGGAIMGNDHYRGMDLLTPVWNFFDLLPEGRGDWFPSLSYDRASGTTKSRRG